MPIKNPKSILALLLVLSVECLFVGGSKITLAQEEAAALNSIAEQKHDTVRKTRIQSGVLFAENQYSLSDLSEKGRQVLQTFAKDLLEAKTEYAQRYPGLSIVATVNITCYSHQNHFPEDSQFIKTLKDDATVQIPQPNPERRQFFNLRLSEFRAKILKTFLQQLLADHDRQDPLVKIKYVSDGKGEKPEETSVDSNSQRILKPPIISLTAEFKIKERGPRVTHPTDILLYEIIEEE